MSATAEIDPRVPATLVEAAMGLPSEARASLAEALIRSLDAPDDDPEVVRAEWKSELAKRIEDIRTGAVQLVDGREVWQRIEERLRERRRK